MEDRELIRQVQKGEIGAFEVLVKKYQKRLLNYVLIITKNKEDAQEVVQDAFFKLYRSIDRVDTSRKFSTYLFAIVKNTAFSFLRRRKREISLDEIQQVPAPEEKLGSAEEVKTALKKLPPKYSKAIRLYYFADLSYKEIAGKLKLPLNTVRTYLRRGKQQLKKSINHEF